MPFLVFLYLIIGVAFAAYADKVMNREEVKKDLKWEPPLYMYIALIFLWPALFLPRALKDKLSK